MGHYGAGGRRLQARNASIPAIAALMSQTHRRIAAGSKIENEVELLQTKWQTAQDLCSLVACNIIFQDCQEGEGYDLSSFSKLVPLY